MTNQANPSVELLSQLSSGQRDQILSGMRWTVWLAALAMPFNYGTTILLARTSPEAIATYGLMIVYITVVSSLFYFGGDPVSLKFVPGISPDQRLSFLLSYFVVICACLIPWLTIASLWPEKLRYLFGEQGGAGLQLFLLFISPLCIVASLIGAALKAQLHLAVAQVLARILTVGFFLIYAIVFLSSPAFVKLHFAAVIWVTFLCLTAIATAAGLYLLLSHINRPKSWRLLHFFLPPGFWPYTLSQQALSALGFFTGRLDVLLVLNFGDLTVLGKYLAIVTFAETTRLINRFFLDTLFPSLTNVLAAQNQEGASQVFSMHMRIIFLTSVTITCGLILLAPLVTDLLGPVYSPLTSMIVLLAMIIGLCAPSNVGGMLLSVVGKQQRAVWISVGQLSLYIMIFLILWPRMHLWGAILAYGISTLVGNLALLLVSRFSVPFRLRIARDYGEFSLTCLAAFALSRWSGLLSIDKRILAWLCVVGFYLILARYSLRECVQLLRCFLPIPAGFLPGRSAR